MESHLIIALATWAAMALLNGLMPCARERDRRFASAGGARVSQRLKTFHWNQGTLYLGLGVCLAFQFYGLAVVPHLICREYDYEPWPCLMWSCLHYASCAVVLPTASLHLTPYSRCRTIGKVVKHRKSLLWISRMTMLAGL